MKLKNQTCLRFEKPAATAADKAHYVWDHLLGSHRDPTCWQRPRAGLEASAWYFQRLEQKLKKQ